MIKDHIDVNLRGRLLLAAGGVALLSACNVNVDASGSTFNTNTNLDAEFSGNNTSVGSGSASSSGGGYYYDESDEDYEEGSFEEADTEASFEDGSGVWGESGVSTGSFADGSIALTEDGTSGWFRSADEMGTPNLQAATHFASDEGGKWYYGTGSMNGDSIEYYYWEEDYSYNKMSLALIVDSSTDQVMAIGAAPSQSGSYLPTGFVSYSGPAITILRSSGAQPMIGDFSMSANFTSGTGSISIDTGTLSIGGNDLDIEIGTGEFSGDIEFKNTNGALIANGEVLGEFSKYYSYYNESEVTGVYYDTSGDSPYAVGTFVGESQ